MRASGQQAQPVSPPASKQACKAGLARLGCCVERNETKWARHLLTCGSTPAAPAGVSRMRVWPGASLSDSQSTNPQTGPCPFGMVAVMLSQMRVAAASYIMCVMRTAQVKCCNTRAHARPRPELTNGARTQSCASTQLLARWQQPHVQQAAIKQNRGGPPGSAAAIQTPPLPSELCVL